MITKAQKYFKERNYSLITFIDIYCVSDRGSSLQSLIFQTRHRILAGSDESLILHFFLTLKMTEYFAICQKHRFPKVCWQHTLCSTLKFCIENKIIVWICQTIGIFGAIISFACTQVEKGNVRLARMYNWHFHVRWIFFIFIMYVLLLQQFTTF